MRECRCVSVSAQVCLFSVDFHIYNACVGLFIPGLPD